MPNAEVHHATLVILAMSTAHVMPVADTAQGNRAKKFWTNGLSAESVAIH
jgi:hypothetical protein